MYADDGGVGSPRTGCEPSAIAEAPGVAPAPAGTPGSGGPGGAVGPASGSAPSGSWTTLTANPRGVPVTRRRASRMAGRRRCSMWSRAKPVLTDTNTVPSITVTGRTCPRNARCWGESPSRSAIARAQTSAKAVPAPVPSVTPSPVLALRTRPKPSRRPLPLMGPGHTRPHAASTPVDHVVAPPHPPWRPHWPAAMQSVRVGGTRTRQYGTRADANNCGARPQPMSTAPSRLLGVSRAARRRSG